MKALYFYYFECLSILLVQSTLQIPYSEIQCTTLLRTFLNHILKDSTGLYVIIFKNHKSFYLHRNMQNFLAESEVPIIYYEIDESDCERSFKAMDFNEHDNYTYLLSASSAGAIDYSFREIHERNCIARYIFVLITSSNFDSYIVMAWTKYELLNVVGLYVDSSSLEVPLDYGQNGCNETLNAFFYDAFVNDGTSKGNVRNFSIFNSNVIQSVDEIRELMAQRLLNLHQYPIRVGLIEFPGLVRVVRDEQGAIIKALQPYADVVNVLATALNFTQIYTFPPDDHVYGGQLPNGSFTGLIGLLEREEVDLTLNLRIMKDYNHTKSTFAPMLAETVLSFITPNNVGTMYESFTSIVDTQVYVVLVMLYILILLVTYGFHYLHRKYILDTKSKFNLMQKSLGIFATILLISYAKPKSIYDKCIFIGMVFTSMIIGFTYEGNMVKILTSDTVSNNIDSLEEIVSSKLKIVLPLGLASYDPFRELRNENGTYNIIQERVILTTHYSIGIKRVVEQRDAALMLPLQFTEVLPQYLYSNETGMSYIHIVKDVSAKVPVALMLRKRSPYNQRFNDAVIKIMESGIYTKICEDAAYKSKLHFLQIPSEPQKINFTMDELGFIFFLWFVIMCMCIAVFLLEVLIKVIFKHDNIN